jgi:hypothetical protein
VIAVSTNGSNGSGMTVIGNGGGGKNRWQDSGVMAMCGVAIAQQLDGRQQWQCDCNGQWWQWCNGRQDSNAITMAMGDGGEMAMQWEMAVLRHRLPSVTHPCCCGGGGRRAADDSGERGGS